MSDLTDALDRILGWIQRISPSLTLSLKPALSYLQIREVIKELPFDLSEEVYELYQWHNGTSNVDETWGLLGYDFNPIEEALNRYHYLINLDRKYRTDFCEIWNINWFPIYSFSAKNHLFIAGNKESEKMSPVREFNIQIGEHIKYNSLTNMMLVIAECWEAGVYYIDESGEIEYDEDSEEAIRQKYNPAAKL